MDKLKEFILGDQIIYIEKINNAIDKDKIYFINNGIDGLFEISLSNDKKEVLYTANNVVKILDYLKINKLNSDEIIKNIVNIITNIENKGFDFNNLIFDINKTFINKANGELFLIYDINSENDKKNNFISYIFEVINLIGNESVLFENFLQLIQKKFLLILKKYLKSTGNSEYLLNEDIFKEDAKENVFDNNFKVKNQIIKEENEIKHNNLIDLINDETDKNSNKKAYLVKVLNGEVKKIYIDSDIWKIGKDYASVQYLIDNETISRVHAIIIKKGNDYYIKDNNSTNGSFVNNSKLNSNEERLLHNNDKIRLSNEVFTFQI